MLANVKFLFRVGFHEAIGDTMALAVRVFIFIVVLTIKVILSNSKNPFSQVNTPTHLRGLGLLPSDKEQISKGEIDKEGIAYLFRTSLQKVF